MAQIELSEEQAVKLAEVTLPVTAFSVQRGVVNGVETIGIIFELDGTDVVYPYSTRETMETIARAILQDQEGAN